MGMGQKQIPDIRPLDPVPFQSSFHIFQFAGIACNGRLEYQEAPVTADMVKTVARIAAFNVDAEGLSVTVGAANVGMAGNAVLAHKDGVGYLASS